MLGRFNLVRKSLEFLVQCVHDTGCMMILTDGFHGRSVKRKDEREFEEHVAELVSEEVKKVSFVISHGLLGVFVQCSNIRWHSVLQ